MEKALFYKNMNEDPVPAVIVKEWEFKGFKVIRYCLIESGMVGEEKDCVENCGFTRFVRM